MQLFRCSSLAGVALAMSSAAALPSAPAATAPATCARLPLPSRTVFQFASNGTWIENLAVGPAGDLYFTTLLPAASLYRLRDPGGPAPVASVVHTVAGAQALTGIAAVTPDTYVVGASNISGGAVVPGTGALWSIRVPTAANGLAEAAARHVVHIAESGLLNGFAALPPGGGGCRGNATVLVADSFKGLVWRVDVGAGTYDVGIQVPEMGGEPIGINGIQVRDGHLYWTNAGTTTIYRLAIDAQGRARPGAAPEALFHVEAAQLDDFTIDAAGTLWVATNADNRLLALGPDGRQEVVLGAKGALAVAGDTAVRFGRGANDKKTLYVTTGGANGAPVNGTITEPAKVVAVDTSACYH